MVPDAVAARKYQEAFERGRVEGEEFGYRRGFRHGRYPYGWLYHPIGFALAICAIISGCVIGMMLASDALLTIVQVIKS